MKNDIVYKISTEDVQEVALKEIGRELNPEEIKAVVPIINDNVVWYEIVADAISANVRTEDLL